MGYLALAVAPQAGDALFIPEGWWHSVESAGGTLAVNHWWASGVSAGLGTAADSFYLRRLSQSLMEQRKQEVLGALPRADLEVLVEDPEVQRQLAQLTGEGLRWSGEGDLSLTWAAAGGDGSSTGQEGLSKGQEGGSPGGGSSSSGSRQQELNKRLEGGERAGLGALLARVEEHERQQLPGPDDEASPAVDAVLASLAAAGSDALMRVLLALRHRRPAAARHLLLRVLSPAGWELLAATGERYEAEGASAGGGAQQAEEVAQLFFDTLYSAVEDRQVLLGVILRRKEALSKRCLAAVLREALSTELWMG